MWNSFETIGKSEQQASENILIYKKDKKATEYQRKGNEYFKIYEKLWGSLFQ